MRFVVIGALAVATIATLTRIPQMLQAAKPEPVSVSGRALAPARLYRLDARLFVSAAREIPAGATYAVVDRERVPPLSDRDAARTFLAYWLLPRRRTDLHSADWIVVISGNLRSLGLRYTRVVRVGHGGELAEVRR